MYSAYNPLDEITSASGCSTLTMKKFAVILAEQLMESADIAMTGGVPRNLTESASPSLEAAQDESIARTRRQEQLRLASRPTLNDSEEEQESKETRLVSTQPQQFPIYEVLEELYDINGKLHQAVRMGSQFDNDGMYCKQVARMCINKFKRVSSDASGEKHVNKCLLYRTRVKCLQCNVALCYPLKLDYYNRQKKNQYCFMTHISKIEKDNSEPERKFTRMVTM